MTAAKKAAPKPRKRTPSASARQAEAEDGYVTLEQCGVALRIPVAGKITLEALDFYLMGDKVGATKAMIGADQWTRLKAAGATLDDLNELDKKLQGASGN